MVLFYFLFFQYDCGNEVPGQVGGDGQDRRLLHWNRPHSCWHIAGCQQLPGSRNHWNLPRFVRIHPVPSKRCIFSFKSITLTVTKIKACCVHMSDQMSSQMSLRQACVFLPSNLSRKAQVGHYPHGCRNPSFLLSGSVPLVSHTHDPQHCVVTKHNLCPCENGLHKMTKVFFTNIALSVVAKFILLQVFQTVSVKHV